MNTELNQLSRRVLARGETEYFLQDLTNHSEQLREAVAGLKVLVIGGAGSIGAEAVRGLARLGPAALHVVDLDESGLAELVRDLRSQRERLAVEDFQTLPLDFGSPVMHRFLRSQEGHDVILNFAALKHVRSEKDPCSLLQLLDTNVVKVARLLRWALEAGAPRRFFSVSTDKAANPVSLMGASKRLMEDATFSVGSKGVAATSARFANVAFSNGSLLDSFRSRLAKSQPLAIPRETLRFFVTLEEAGHLCLLAALAAPSGHLLIPGPDFRAKTYRFEDLAVNFLRAHGLEARICDDESEARESVASDRARGSYPVLTSARDTSGEKACEEFVGEGERATPVGFLELDGVAHVPGTRTRQREVFLAEMEALCQNAEQPMTKAGLVDRVADVLPAFAHLETGRSLDDRM